MTRLPPERGRSTILLFVFLLSLWMVLSWQFSIHHPLLFWLGLGSTTVVAVLARRMQIVDRETVPVHLLPRFPSYALWLTGQVIASCIDVLRRGARVKPRITPQVVVISSSPDSDVGKVTLANSITLTPGTTSLDADIEADTITVHAISNAAAAALREGVMARRVERLEGRVRLADGTVAGASAAGAERAGVETGGAKAADESRRGS